MLFLLWRRVRKSGPASLPGNEPPKGHRPSFRPQFEVLEGRIAPAELIHGALSLLQAGTTARADAAPPQPGGTAPSGALSGVQPIGSQPAGAGVKEMQVTVKENSPATVIDLGAVFAGMSGIQHEDGLQLSLLGNTNAGLVKTDLSKGELTLTYTPSQSGTATIMVAATDADGVSVQVNIVVTVLPQTPANGNTAGTTSISSVNSISTTTGTFVPAPSVSAIL